MAIEFIEDGLHTHLTQDFQRSQLGVWSMSQVYFCRSDQFPQVLPENRSPHPDYPFVFLTDISSVDRQEGGWYLITCKYEGVLDQELTEEEVEEPGEVGEEEEQEEEEGPQYEFSLEINGEVQEALATHQRYDDLSARDKMEATEMALNPPRAADGAATSEPIDLTDWSDLKRELYEDLSGGQEAYLGEDIVWKRRYVTNVQPTSMNSVGNIAPAPGSPRVSQGRNWRFAGMSYTQSGSVFTVEESYRLSARGGWSERYYSE